MNSNLVNPLLQPLKDLVKVIRNFECGDYSPIMDEIFDAEYAIREVEKVSQNRVLY